MKFYNTLKSNLSICVGNIVEWYDLSLYIITSATLGQLFFYNLAPHLQTLITYLIFGLSIIARNLGSWIFGRLALRINPRTVYRVIVRLCIISTLFIGLLPTYQQIGALAGYLLILLRLLQGICAGAQYPGALTLLYTNNKQHAQSCILAHITSLFGYCLAAILILILQHTLSTAHFNAWGWRIGFVSSVFLWLIADKLQPLLKKDWSELQKTIVQHIPIYQIWQEHKTSMAATIYLSLIGGICYFTTFVFLLNILKKFTNISTETINAIQILCWASSCFSSWHFSKIADKYTFKSNILLGCGLLIISSCLFPALLSLQNTAALLIASLLLITANSIIISGILPEYCRVFAKSNRFTAAAISYNIGTSISGILTSVLMAHMLSLDSVYSYTLTIIITAAAGALYIILSTRKQSQIKTLT